MSLDVSTTARIRNFGFAPKSASGVLPPPRLPDIHDRVTELLALLHMERKELDRARRENGDLLGENEQLRTENEKLRLTIAKLSKNSANSSKRSNKLRPT